MIKLRLINDSNVVLNSDMIESIEATPDTLISLSTGKKMMVKESVTEVVARIVEFRRLVGRSGEDKEQVLDALSNPNGGDT